MSKHRVLASAIAVACCICIGGVAVQAAPPGGTGEPTFQLVADEGAPPVRWITYNSTHGIVPRGGDTCQPCPGCITLCNNSQGSVVDCSTSYIQNIRCGATGSDPFTNTENGYVRIFDLAAEPQIGPGNNFEVHCVRFPIRILNVDPNVVPEVTIDVTIYFDTNGFPPVNPVTEPGGDLAPLGTRRLTIPTMPSIDPCDPSPCPFGVIFEADFSACPPSVPMNTQMVVEIFLVDDLTEFGDIGQVTLGCSEDTPTMTGYFDTFLKSASCGFTSYVPMSGVLAAGETRQTVVEIEGIVGQPLNLGACCDRSTGICVTVTADACLGQFDVYTPCVDCATAGCVEARGACCNEQVGTCLDNVNIANCILAQERFVEGETCGTMDPPCTSSVGNDACLNALPLPIPSVTFRNTLWSGPATVPRDCDAEINAPGLWWTMTGTGNSVTVSMCGGTDYDGKLFIYCSEGTPIDCEDDPATTSLNEGLVCVGNDDDSCTPSAGVPPTITLCTIPGQTYWLFTHGWDTSTGHFRLELSDDGLACSTAAPCEPSGACCLNFCGGCVEVTDPECTALTGNPANYIGDFIACGPGLCGFPTVAECCRGDTNQDGEINGSDVSTMVAALITPPDCIQEPNEFCLADVNGDSLITLDDASAFVSALLAGATCNDYCSSAVSLSSNTVIVIDNSGASTSATDLDFSCHGSGTPDPGAGSLWFTFQATHDSIQIRTCGDPATGNPSPDSIIAVYAGNCGFLTEVGCAEDQCGATGLMSDLCVLPGQLTIGQTYLLEVASFDDTSQGSMLLELISPHSCPTPANDDCANAITIMDGVTPFTTVLATTDGPVNAAGSCTSFWDDQVHNDVWYAYTATCTGTVSISTCNLADYDTKLALYSGTCGALSLEACLDDTLGCTNFTTTLTASVTNGTTYLLRVGGNLIPPPGWGSGDITITCP